jgi:hypothetical protein
MAGWRSEVRDVVDIVKLLQKEEKEEDRALHKELFGVCGGAGIRSADIMNDVLHSRGGLSVYCCNFLRLTLFLQIPRPCPKSTKVHCQRWRHKMYWRTGIAS